MHNYCELINYFPSRNRWSQWIAVTSHRTTAMTAQCSHRSKELKSTNFFLRHNAVVLSWNHERRCDGRLWLLCDETIKGQKIHALRLWGKDFSVTGGRGFAGRNNRLIIDRYRVYDKFRQSIWQVPYLNTPYLKISNLHIEFAYIICISL